MVSQETQSLIDLGALPPEQRYLNRELSWLAFNQRVLEEACDRRHPLLERVKFIAIFSSNLDEFFMVRIAGLRQQIDAGVTQPSLDGLSPQEQLPRIQQTALRLMARQRQILYNELKPELAAQGIELLAYHELTIGERERADAYFHSSVFPALTPLAIDRPQPFPHISALSINLLVVLRDREGEQRLARVKVPHMFARLLDVGLLDGQPSGRRFVWLEDLVCANLSALFSGMEVLEAYTFRLIRNADVDLQEEEAADLMRTIEQGLRKRHFGRVVNLFVSDSMPENLQQLLMERLGVTSRDLYRLGGRLGLRSLRELMAIDRADLKDPQIAPAVPPAVASADSIFDAIRRRDVLVHHPYDSFTTVEDFIEEAAEDPNVLAIKQTLYRVGRDSVIVRALTDAREDGKEVATLVELKARFDEENNITWARTLDRAGVHVVYGFPGLKTHGKLALVVRRERDGIRCYVHLSTGNYNATTAQLYTDIGMFTCDPEIGADVSELFNYLTGYSELGNFRRLLVAPSGMREGLIARIEREIDRHLEHGGGRLIFKTNALIDRPIIDALYRASGAGVEIDLIVRGVCCLRPGIPGLSETITVRSIVGRLLEHSRIYYFRNGGDEEIYIGSADLMTRNLSRRVEALFPVLDTTYRAYIAHDVLETMLRDTANARVLQPDGGYVRLRGTDGSDFDSQLWLLARHH